jgi:hypothetical protein
VKILHLVTLISTDGAFGGPTGVALNQAAELRRRARDVQVVSAYSTLTAVGLQRNNRSKTNLAAFQERRQCDLHHIPVRSSVSRTSRGTGLLQVAGPRIAANLHPLVIGGPRLRSHEFVTGSIRTCCSWPDFKC